MASLGVSLLLVCSLPSSAATLIAETFDVPDARWQAKTLGTAKCSQSDAGMRGRCLKVEATGGLAFYTRELPLDEVRGATLSVRCHLKLEGVQRGPQTHSLAKVLISVATPEGTRHFAARAEGTADWHQESFLAEVPDTATKVLLLLGIENAVGTVWFDSLIVESDRRAVKPLDFRASVNRSFRDETAADGKGGFTDDGPNDLRGLQPGVVEWNGIPFRIIDPAANNDRSCIVLRGEARPDFPDSPEQPVPVGAVANKLYLLHAAAWGKDSRETPCMIYDLTYWDGRVAHLSIFEGREIGPLNSTADLSNWKIAWKGVNGNGDPVALGVTEWTIYDTTPIESLTARAYQGAVPVIVAATLVQDPPPKPSTDEDYGEGEDYY